MDLSRILMLLALGLFLLEGFTLSLFPTQFKQLLTEMEPRHLQLLGLVETIVALGLMAGILAG
jgi:uncharacterized protein YjeT (DUF2065 family)